MKQLKISKYLLIAIYLTALYSVTIVKNFIKSSDVELYNAFNIGISWIPLIVFFAVAIIYSFFMCSEKLLSARKYIYGCLLFQFITVTIIMIPINISIRVHWFVWGIIISVNFIVSEIFNSKIDNLVSNMNFSLANELNTMDEVKKTMEQSPNYRFSKMFNRMWFFYAISYSFSASPIVFSVLISAIACFAFYNFFKFQVDYIYAFGAEKSKKIFKVSSVFFWSFIALGIVLYILLEFKFPSFVAVFASFIPKYINDNKYAMELRKNKIENKLR